ncbi:AAA family ATPase [Virgibacillus sp. AGTR]|uniref:AAA family ATPase n=1 Tax=Virgibacillus sp. AGTR TaxID=2812055 RepID=UPI001D163E8C|nr:AAA family ATPase [Virgibacillus sp. AGTR]MCC2248833.1 AAA family ATPase [Virgibacillus sp. AGTR]
MTQYSYSRVSLFEDCPYHFKLRYVDKLTEIPDWNNPANPLLIGNALHKGIETDVPTAIDEYFKSFPGINDRMVEESMKLEILIPKVKQFLEENFVGFEYIHEYKIDKPNYIGFVDLILTTPNGESMVIDFKYSNHIKNYMDSGQLHLYKHYLEEDGFDVKRMAYLFVPKTSIKQKQDEDLFHFRKRLVQEVEDSSVKMVPIEYDEMNVVYFKNSIKKIETAKSYPKNVSGNCFSCNPRFQPNYLEAIQNEKGEIIMALPKNERRELTIDENPDFWIYGDSYVGKSTFVDNISNLLFLNTDGNTDNTTAPVIPIKDEVKKEGRRTLRKLAWEVFLETINDLETEENTYEAVALDLVEDLYEHCRFYVFEQNGWEHESDGSYGKGWSKVTTEWQKAIKRLKALGYQIGYVSKELRKDITLKGGSVRTTFTPNINEKVANFLTGTVDLTMRAFSNSDDERFLQLEKKNNVFGGGRYDWKVETCALDYDEFLEELKAAQEGKSTKRKKKESTPVKEDSSKRERKKSEAGPDEQEENAEDSPAEEKPKRTRKKRDPEPEETTEEEQPKRQRRSRKSDDEENEEKPKRQRRQRNAVDDTPPGEEEDADEKEVEKPKRTRRRRSRGEKK